MSKKHDLVTSEGIHAGQITDEFGYLHPKQENEPDFFNVPSTFSTECKRVNHPNLNQLQGGNELSSFVRDEGDAGSVDIVHSYFGFRDGLVGDELSSPDYDGDPGVERPLQNGKAFSPTGATSDEAAGTLQIQHSYFGFRDAVGEDKDYQSEIQGKHNRLRTHHDNASGCEKDEKEESCLLSVLLPDRDTGNDEIIHSYFGIDDVPEKRRPEHSIEQNDCVKEEDKVRLSYSPSRRDGNNREPTHFEIHPGEISSDMAQHRWYESMDSHVSIPSADCSASPSFQHTYLAFSDLQEQQSKGTHHNYEVVDQRGNHRVEKTFLMSCDATDTERKDGQPKLDEHEYLVLDEIVDVIIPCNQK